MTDPYSDGISLDCVLIPQDNMEEDIGLGFFIYKPGDAFGYETREEFKDGRLPMLYTKMIILPPRHLFRSKKPMQGWLLEHIICTTSDKEHYWEKVDV